MIISLMQKKIAHMFVINFMAALMEKWISVVIKIEDWPFIFLWWACNTAKTYETTVTGHSITSGQEFWNHTQTHGCDTMELPVPVLHPTGLVDICATCGVMAAVGAVIGQGLGWAFGRGSTDALACWGGTASALAVFAALAFCWALQGITDEWEV